MMNVAERFLWTSLNKKKKNAESKKKKSRTNGIEGDPNSLSIDQPKPIKALQKSFGKVSFES